MRSALQPRSARPISAQAAAALVRPGDWIDYGVALGQPDAFDRALAARKAELTDVSFRACLSTRSRAVLEADPGREHFKWYNWHFSGYDRAKHDAGLCHYIPCNLGEIPDYYRRFIDPVDVCVIRTRPADRSGRFNLSVTNLWQRAIAERARIVIVETCAALPYVHGEDNSLGPDEVDFVIEGDESPLAELPTIPVREADRAVGRYIAAEIEDGACLQIGIGAMPNAVCLQLQDSGVRDLGVHTEMLTDGIGELYRLGIVTGARKTLDPGKTAFSFALGSKSLYQTLDGDEHFQGCAVEYTNLPHQIMRNERVVAINNTTEMDLQGQAASESCGHRQISGTGGQLQFVRGAYASPGGKSFICLASTYERHGVRKSRIVLDLTPGNIVTTPRSDMMYVVTEYGIANLKGRSVPERARLLIGLAHPDFRDSLERAAFGAGLLARQYVPVSEAVTSNAR